MSATPKPEETLEFTGERFLPSCEREIWYEHYHRYTMALPWVNGLTVLDAACGEGYGSHILASQAEQVIGFDLSAAAIKHAQTHYPKDNLRFKQANVLDLPIPDHSVDVVVSFETLEHLAEHEQLMQSFKRVLKPGGILIVSTPDKAVYTDQTGVDNEFHVKELYRHEFSDLLQAHFQHHHLLGQKLMFTSKIWDLESTPKTIQMDCVMQDGSIQNQLPFDPVYLIGIASDQPINPNQGPQMYAFTEEAETVYGHYHAVIRAHIAAEKALQQAEHKQQAWLKHPLIGRMIRWFGQE